MSPTLWMTMPAASAGDTNANLSAASADSPLPAASAETNRANLAAVSAVVDPAS